MMFIMPNERILWTGGVDTGGICGNLCLMMNEHISRPQKSKPTHASSGQKRERKPPKKITPSYLKNSGLAYLQRFPTSTSHFTRIMMRKIDRSCRHHTEQNKDECIGHLNQVIVQFQELGLLNDAGYLQGMVNSLRRKGVSTMAMMAKLSLKGYSSSQILEACQVYDDEHPLPHSPDVTAAIKLIFKKRMGPFRQNDKKTPEQEMALLARRGFDFDTIQRVLKMNAEDAEKIIYALG
jgi:regulatory protein